MKLNRKDFLQLLGLVPVIKTLGTPVKKATGKFPVVISTWAPNMKANLAAWKLLLQSSSAIDAIEAGIRITEADPTDTSVGLGGLPDRDGRVTLDACIMDDKGNAGSVVCLEHIMHPISVARLVMEKTPHVMLAGEGALQLALQNGYRKQQLLTAESEKAWKNWLIQSKYDPNITVKELEERSKQTPSPNEYSPWPLQPYPNHDTIGMLALDVAQNLSGGCSTSGMAYKMHGRVGDSPIIGAGLFVDNEVGAATCSGLGEEILKVCGAHTVVEMMRSGATPEEACKEAVKRIARNNKNSPGRTGLQAGFIALDKQGNFGAFALQKNFTYAVKNNDIQEVFEAKSLW